MNELILRYSKYNDCVQNQIYTIMHSFGLECEITYIDMMEFCFDYKNYVNNKWQYIGELISIDDSIYTANLTKYFDIETHIEYCEDDEVICKIDKSLSSDAFVIVLLNSFWCPWEWAYQDPKYSGFTHAFIVKERIENYYLCMDGHKNKKDCIINVAELKEGFLGKFLSMKLNNTKMFKINWRESIRYAAKNLLTKKNDYITSDHIRLFARAISKDLNLKKELKGYETDDITMFKAPLFIKLYTIRNMRKKFNFFLDYIEDKFKLNLLDDVIKEVDIVSHEWETLCRSMVKCYYSFQRRYVDEVVDTLDDIAAREEGIARMMFEKSFI